MTVLVKRKRYCFIQPPSKILLSRTNIGSNHKNVKGGYSVKGYLSPDPSEDDPFLLPESADAPAVLLCFVSAPPEGFL